MIREPYLLPRVSRQNYQTLHGLPGSDLPDTYDEWFKLFTKQKLERGQAGFDVHEIEIDPHEFAQYCGERGIPPDGHRLLDFANEKGVGSGD
jgi:hypothetical protein